MWVINPRTRITDPSGTELSRVQGQLHLEDASKGTYRKIVDETEEDILQCILLKLLSLLCRFKERGAPWDYICNSIIRRHPMLSREASNAVMTVLEDGYVHLETAQGCKCI